MTPDLKNKLKLTALLLVTVLPLTLATLVFRSASDGGIGSTANKGHLINPPADITALAMTDVTGTFIFRNFEEEIAELGDAEYQARPWLMLYVTAKDCDAECESRVHYMRQLHITLGKDIERVRRYYLQAAPQPLNSATAELFRAEYPSMGVAFSDQELLEQNMEAAGVPLNLDLESYILLVDPVGNVMMYYTKENTAEDIMSDLETLLKYSSLG